MKKTILSILFSLSLNLLYSQHLDLVWSDDFVCNNKADGFFDEFVGSNSQFVYAKYHRSQRHPDADIPDNKEKYIKLFAMDKNSSKKMHEAVIKSDQSKSGDLDYHSVYVFENSVQVYFTKKKNKVIEVYVHVYDAKLKSKGDLKKVYEVNNPNSKLSDGGLLILMNKSNNILLGAEIIDKDNKELKLDYRILNSDLSVVNSKQITLPLIVESMKRNFNNSYWYNNYRYNYSQKRGAICWYVLANNGDLLVFADVTRKKDESAKNSKKNSENYTKMFRISTLTGDINTRNLEFENKDIDTYRLLESEDELTIIGLYSTKNDKSSGINGIFRSKFNKDLEPKDLKFTSFDKRFISDLFAKDQEELEKRRNKSDKKNDLSSELSGFYFIEKVQEDKGNLVLFCSKIYNYLVQECQSNSNGGTTCYTIPYCEKSNVTAFKISPEGEIVWAKNIDRSATYRGYWNVLDLHVIQGKENYNVIYGSDYHVNSTKKSKKNRKQKKQKTDYFEYATISKSNGSYKKQEFKINQINTPKEKEKKIVPTNLWVFDNQIYTHSHRVKLKGSTYISCLCPPAFVFLMNGGNSYKGSGNVGVIKSLN